MRRRLLLLLSGSILSWGATAVPKPGELPALIPSPQRIEVTAPHKMALLDIRVKIDTTLDLPPEGYVLETSRRRAVITAKDERGALWGRRTLYQLADEKGLVPYVKITDWPAFPIRAFMHDVGRNFLPVETLKKHLDILAQYKINAFHWHLTDYPAWRIESRAYPALNDARYQRKDRDPGKFYTYGEIRDVIAYARERGILVIPEIDMPGHSTYFNTTFGFGMSDPRGMKILEKCIDEFFAEIPASDCPYLHIGSDEIHIPNPEEFMAWADSLVRANGRIPMVWDPGLPAGGTTVRQIWSDAAAEAVVSDRTEPYVDSYMGYLNYYDPVLLFSRIFLHDPCGKAQGDERALGGILCLWNDVRVADKEKIVSHNGAWSGLLPFAERFWKGGLTPEGVVHPELLPDPLSEAGKALAEFERRAEAHRTGWLGKEPVPWRPNAALKWRVSEPTAVGADTVSLRWYPAYGGSVDVNAFCKSMGLEDPETGAVWAETVLTVPKDTVIEAWVGFEAPARSNRLSVGIGRQGEWEAGGRIWVNGAEIAPPVWQEPGAYAFHFNTWHKPEEEIPYTDEQLFWTRTPSKIQLRAGENRIVLYAPKVFAGQRWSFAFVPL